MKRTLYVNKGFCLDTPSGYQKIMQQYGSTCYIVHNYDENDTYLFASYITDREIIHKYHDMTGIMYSEVVFC